MAKAFTELLIMTHKNMKRDFQPCFIRSHISLFPTGGGGCSEGIHRAMVAELVRNLILINTGLKMVFYFIRSLYPPHTRVQEAIHPSFPTASFPPPHTYS